MLAIGRRELLYQRVGGGLGRYLDIGSLPCFGQELADIAWRLAGESRQDARQVALWIDLVALGRRDERIQKRRGATSAVVGCKKPIPSANRHPLKRPLSDVFVDIEVALAGVRVQRKSKKDRHNP